MTLPLVLGACATLEPGTSDYGVHEDLVDVGVPEAFDPILPEEPGGILGVDMIGAEMVPMDAPEIEIPDVGPVDPEDYFGFHPMELNVIVIGDLGEAKAPYCSDFQGAAAIGGDAHFGGFSLNALDASPTDVALWVGGELRFSGSVAYGDIETEGDMDLYGIWVGDNLWGGADLEGNGSIGGDATLAGLNDGGLDLTIAGTVTEGAAFTPTLDLYVLGAYMEAFSSVTASKVVTTTASESYGEITIDVVSGMNVVEIDAQDLDDAWGVTVDGPADASLYINVGNTTATLDSMVWNYTGGVAAENALLNYHAATDIELTGGNHAINILAPLAVVNFANGLVTGNLVALELYGCGQVNLGYFCCNPWDDKKVQ
jgi:choice-of-anchor A domain-containing protein